MEKRKTTVEQRTCGDVICSSPHLTSHRHTQRGQIMTEGLSMQNKIQSHVHLQSHKPLSWFLPLSSSQMINDRSDAVKALRLGLGQAKDWYPFRVSIQGWLTNRMAPLNHAEGELPRQYVRLEQRLMGSSGSPCTFTGRCAEHDKPSEETDDSEHHSATTHRDDNALSSSPPRPLRTRRYLPDIPAPWQGRGPRQATWDNALPRTGNTSWERLSARTLIT